MCSGMTTIMCFLELLKNCTSTGSEHSATASGAGQPSYCTLPMFHPPRNPNDHLDGRGYISNDGHLFDCKNPVVSQQAFHVYVGLHELVSERANISNLP